MIKKIMHFLDETLWRMELSERSKWFRCVIHPLRFLLLTIKSLLRDGAMLHASALTYITMLAIVPVLALTLTTLKAFGAGDVAEEKMKIQIERFVGQMAMDEEALPTADTAPAPAPQQVTSDTPPPAGTVRSEESDAERAANALTSLCESVFKQINEINFAKMGVVGAVVLIFMVISVLGKVEASFNVIWGVKKGRNLWRKFSDYLSVLIIMPMLILAATSIPILETLAAATGLHGLIGFVDGMGIFNWLVPLLLGTTLLAFLFGFLPNTHVKISSAFLGGFITILILTAFFKLCMVMQFGIANNSRLYGSFIALPILLFWIYASWQIILIGAEICYVFQYRHELLRESAFSHPSERDTIVIALALICKAAHQVEVDDGQRSPVFSVEDFANELAIPTREVLRIATILEKRNLLLAVPDANGEMGMHYLLTRDAARLKVYEVINACLDNTDGEEVITRTGDFVSLKAVQAMNTRFSEMLMQEFSVSITEVLKLVKADLTTAQG